MLLDETSTTKFFTFFFLPSRCLAAVQEEEKAQWMATSYDTLIQAKKENVALQLEAAYRERLQEAYQQVRVTDRSTGCPRKKPDLL